ncbi:DUF2982 domain-containing protein [Shewanella profunda]|uniref:DUF2982 domain-containing protein n=1 Tax=Shewanella profunda TaxID=254793 RepID=UPI00200C9F26|nr:DUF2982 domain-containing protein [Shewanella profunda]MCL1088527.1 DUF2982 domain-containing protein [Shewanella profunda]
MALESDVISVRPLSKRNGLTLTWVGASSLILGFGLFIIFPEFFAIGLVFFSLGAIALILGLAKVYEPETTISLDEQGLIYFHRRGKVFIAWDNIQRVDIPRVTQGINTIELSYLGIKLKHLNPILDNISLRLATGLLTEQRPLLVTAASQQEDLATLETYMGTEFSPLVIEGDRYRGVLAMFGHRCVMLDTHLGYHLYIPHDSLDREPQDFIKLLRQRIAQGMS